MGNKLKFSSALAEKNFERMLLPTKWLAIEMHLWALSQGVTLTFTETWTTKEEDLKRNRQSDTHRTGRAFDIRTKDLTPEFIEKFVEHFTEIYNSKMGAIVKDKPSLIVYRPHGTGPHFHVQIRRDYHETI